jgi:WD40 repeat protein
LEQEFLAASEEWAQQQDAEREAQRQRELEAARRLAEERARSAARLRRGAVWLAMALLVALVAAVTAGFDGLGAVWDLASGQVTTLTHDEPFLFGIAFNPDGSRVATVSPMTEQAAEEIGVFEWDAVTGEELRMFPVDTLSIYSVRYSPDGKLLVAGLQEGDIQVWDTASGALVRTLTGHTGIVPELAFSPDGKHLASRSQDVQPRCGT